MKYEVMNCKPPLKVHVVLGNGLNFFLFFFKSENRFIILHENF